MPLFSQERGEMPLFSQKRGDQNRGRKEFTFLWIIENCSYCWPKSGEALNSPDFTADVPKGNRWELLLYPGGFRVEDKGFISLGLRRCSDENGPEKVSIMYELSVLAEDGSAISSKETEFSFARGSRSVWPDTLRVDKIFFQRNFPQDILTVRCKMWRDEGNAHMVAHMCARTRLQIKKISFLHEVENFSTLLSNQKVTINISRSNQSLLASSSLYFNHVSCRDGEMIVEITPSDGRRFIYKLKILLLGSENAIGCGEDDNFFDVERMSIRKLPLSLTRQAILDKKTEYLSDDKLSLLCECSFYSRNGLFQRNEVEQIEEIQCEMPMATAKRTNYKGLSKNDDNTVEKVSAYPGRHESFSAYPGALEDMKALYVDQCLSDVELKTKTKSFPAHKNVLCARSPVFKRMMTSDMKEKYTNRIQVDDLRDDVVQQLLLFLYSDTLENLQWEMATQLYYAADKYQVGKLKEVCSSFLVANLSPNNAGELLLLADTHSDGDLKKMVEDFILEHEKEVFASDEWEIMMDTNPVLVMKTMQLKYKR